MFVDQCSLTQAKEMKYTWNIDNFNSEKTGHSKNSPCFSVGTNDDIKWRLRVYPKGHKNSKFVALFLKLDSCNKTEVIARYVFSIIDGKGKQTYIRERKRNKFNQGKVYGYNEFIDRNEIDRLLTRGKLTICCEMSVDQDTVNNGEMDQLKIKFPKGCVLDDIGKLYDDMKLSDVTLVADGREMRAHKVILAARSEVFAAMFEHNMQERKLSRVDITDLDHEVLTEMLHFIYTDRAHNLDKMAAGLLVAADKYKLDNLRLLCEEALLRNLSIETAADTLVLADLHSVDWLKKQTTAFINSIHVRKVMATVGWQKMISTNPHLVAELFSDITLQVQQHLPKPRLRSDAGCPLPKKLRLNLKDN